MYAKKPFGGPETVLRYLSNYTHRVGMSSRQNPPLGSRYSPVSFRYRDYAHGGKIQVLHLDTGEFARRFCLHILPKGFCKVRHYGLLGNRGREQRLEKVRAAIVVAKARVRPQRKTVVTPVSSPEPQVRCPYCGSRTSGWFGCCLDRVAANLAQTPHKHAGFLSLNSINTQPHQRM